MKKLALLLALFPALLLAHPGGLDQNGGHTDRKTGQYHTHRAPQTPPPKPSTSSQHHGAAQSQPTQNTSPTTGLPKISGPLAEEQIDARVQEYFRHTNAGVINILPRLPSPRNVSDETKRSVIARDGGACVVCGSTVQLEVDHRIALMNGGTNSETNLSTLCDSCHLKKTRLDNSLRRKREEKFGKPRQ